MRCQHSQVNSLQLIRYENGHQITLNPPKNGRKFQKSILEGKMLFATLNYSKHAFKTATLGRFIKNITKYGLQRAGPGIISKIIFGNFL